MGLLRRRDRESALPLEEVLQGARLPTFPQVATAALERLGDPEVDMREVGDLLVTDPAISARLLSLVNSAASGVRRTVDNVHQAAVLIGTSQLESTLIAVGVQQAMPDTSVAGQNSRAFWTAAARRASIATAFAERVVPSTRSETFTAALLQDMAVPLLAASRSDYDRLIDQWRSGAADLASLEEDAFGSDHARVAGQMCEAWNFPVNLRLAIESHHDDPQTSQGIPFVQLVSVLRDVEEDSDRVRLIELAHTTLELAPEDTDALIVAAEHDAAAIAALLG